MGGSCPAPAALGSLARAAGRISVLFCTTAVIGLPFAVRSAWTPWASVVLIALLGCLLVAVRTFVLGGGERWCLVMIAMLCFTTALVSASTDVLRPDAMHQIVSWMNAGVGGAVGFLLGARWGAATFLCGMITSLTVEHATGGTLSPDTIIGPLTYVLGSSLGRGAALRGDAAIERALTAKETAEAALRIAEQRWEAARAAQRELHDTVLATLTMLSHRGVGVPPETVVRACERDAEALRRGTLVGVATAASGPVRVEGPAADPRAGPVSSGEVGLMLRSQIEPAVDDARAAGLDVRLHLSGPQVGAARLSAQVAIALRDALRECLRNVGTHAGVEAADVTVVVDEGRANVVVLDEGCGFDPSTIPEDRLGLRESVAGRLAAVGGEATVWSGSGCGTSILLAVPLDPFVRPPARPS